MSDPLRITPKIEIPATDLTYEFSRSGGPGGQHVNTTDTRVRQRFALATCEVLRDDVKDRLRKAHPAWMTADGELILTSDATRSRHRNIEEVRERLAAAIVAVLVPPKVRRKTRPSRGAKQRRLNDKKRRSEVKQSRGRVKSDD